jgi:hypothetical protein
VREHDERMRQQARVDDCRDLATLERWLDLAVMADSADEALG